MWPFFLLLLCNLMKAWNFIEFQWLIYQKWSFFLLLLSLFQIELTFSCESHTFFLVDKLFLDNNVINLFLMKNEMWPLKFSLNKETKVWSEAKTKLKKIEKICSSVLIFFVGIFNQSVNINAIVKNHVKASALKTEKLN